MSKKALPVIIITVCLLFAGCKAPADQEQKSNTETAVLCIGGADIKKRRTTTAMGNCVAKNGRTRKIHTMFWKLKLL